MSAIQEINDPQFAGVVQNALFHVNEPVRVSDTVHLLRKMVEAIGEHYPQFGQAADILWDLARVLKQPIITAAQQESPEPLEEEPSQRTQDVPENPEEDVCEAFNPEAVEGLEKMTGGFPLRELYAWFKRRGWTVARVDVRGGLGTHDGRLVTKDCASVTVERDAPYRAHSIRVESKS